ncbi:pilin [Patescibacteria group bacterium]|nr:pilin [Patescibacteria group bacterium]MBU1663335.1 pilin [Patescibacteria group bacterium]MBU1933680.1 pilin [Patescibacteria group bacterium]MBU2008109.1 pilin [Patescibacteria group bacterium]MBU2233454.1 pilin [Patescibacteria group bacterium]
MKKILFKKAVVLAMALFVLTPVLAFSLPALAEDLDPWGGKKEDVKTSTGLTERDPREIAASIINVILGFLGIVAVIIILLGGFKWMTAGGDEEKAGEARKLITSGIIGLIIIIAAFAIATFVLDSLLKATAE